jgi:processive 1,2-diacylglycerol beta-glucosyltransferase
MNASPRPVRPAGVNGHAPTGRPRVLILSVSAGTGHLRAAQAVELALRERAPHAFVRNVDVLDHALPPFRRCYGGMYLDFVDLAPPVLGFFYTLMDSADHSGPNFWDRLRLSLEQFSLRSLIALVLNGHWDLIISTHFLPGEILAALRREGRLPAPHVIVTTDFETHRLWVNQPCEHYFTATEEAAVYLERFGVPPRDVSAVGIPIHPDFNRPLDRAACRARHGLPGDRPVVLQLAGGHGCGRTSEILRALLDVEGPLDLVVVTGRNPKRKAKLEATPAPARHRVRVLGYTDHIHELMAAADLVVTKPGGLTTSELLAVGAAVVVVDPIPGQEDRNSDYLLENGAAVKVNHSPTLAYKVTSLLRDPEHLARLRANARRLARPRAAFDVVERSLAVLRMGNAEWGMRNGHTQADAATDGVTPSSIPHSPFPIPHLPPPERLRRAWRASRDWFDLLEVEALHLFARVWHDCAPGGDGAPPPRGPALIVANHPSHSDPAFLVSAGLRPLCFLHAGEYFNVPVLRKLFERAGCIPVKRDGHDAAAVREALRRLDQGRAVCVFPEGDISPGDGHAFRRARTGAAFLALRTRAPVYPALILGGPRSHHLLRDWLWPSSGVRVVFGPRINLSPYYGRPITHALLREVTALLMRKIAELGPADTARGAGFQPAMPGEGRLKTFPTTGNGHAAGAANGALSG